jgi:predicted DsbA family dithiol-disulfide isomerase
MAAMASNTLRMPDKKSAARIIVFADYACPNSYIGQRRLAQLHEVLDLVIDWCFIEGRPQTPMRGTPVGELGMPAEVWRALMDNLARMAAREKLPFREPTLISNSRKAILLAEAVRTDRPSAFNALHEGLYAAGFAEGQDIGDETVLRSLADAAGIDKSFFDYALGEPQFAERLRANQELARRIGLQATPAFIIGEQVLEGAVPTAMLAEMLVEIHEPH